VDHHHNLPDGALSGGCGVLVLGLLAPAVVVLIIKCALITAAILVVPFRKQAEAVNARRPGARRSTVGVPPRTVGARRTRLARPPYPHELLVRDTHSPQLRPR